jgi:sugar (pentulose or hexulose) kinase
MSETYLAIDLGASSGRTIAGHIENDQLQLHEINRFWNGPIDLQGHLHWDFLHLYRQLREGLATAQNQYPVRSLSIDTWGVDFGLLDTTGSLLQNPVHYRDERTNGMFNALFKKSSREHIFEQTGIQFMEINTLYQLYALHLQNAPAYTHAHQLLFSPDLLTYWLTGQKIAERTIASTSQCYNPQTQTWAHDLLQTTGIRTDLFADLVDPGTPIGTVDGVSVIAAGGHDTACAFAAVPTQPNEQAAFLSSGTWSLLGCELPKPRINNNVLEKNFTNEVGVCNTIRFLKNLNGLWIIQELQRIWKQHGHEYTFTQMVEMAQAAEPFHAFINPADERFFTPGDMHQRICEYCQETHQPIPQNHAQTIRIAYEGLALLYAETLDDLEILSERTFDCIRIVGGGGRNHLLNQMTANATARPVHSGPTEATAIGNCIMQMIALGDLTDLAAGRTLIRNSFAQEMESYPPTHTSEWQTARQKWKQIINAA